MRTVLGLGAILLFVVGCATTERQEVSVKDQPAVCRFLGEACNNLVPGGEGEASLRYVNPNAKFTQYNKAKVEVVGFFAGDTAKVPAEARQTMTDLFQKSLNEALAKKFEIVDRPRVPG